MIFIYCDFKENKRMNREKKFYVNNCLVWCKKKCFFLNEIKFICI